MQTHDYVLSGVGSYEFNTSGDCYSGVTTLPSGAATYYIEVSNGGNVWVDHPGLAGANPQNAGMFGTLKSTFVLTRVRATANSGDITIRYQATEFGR